VPRTLERSFEVDGVLAQRILRFREAHVLGQPPSLEIDVRFSAYQPIDNLVGHGARLRAGFAGEPVHQFVGVVEEATLIGSPMMAGSGEACTYVLRVVPRLGLLGRSVDARIFLEKDVREIVTEVLKDHGIEGDAVEWRLAESYEKRVYCVQYQESALAFVSRLCEEEGIHFFVEATDAGDKVVLSDQSASAQPIEGDKQLAVRARTALDADRDFALLPTDTRRIRSGKYVLRDYNFEKPALDLTVTAEADADGELEVYDHPGAYEDKAVGDRRARVRLEADRAWCQTVEVQCSCPRVAAGRKLELTDAGDLDGEYVVVEAVHELAETGREGGSLEVDYHVRTLCVPAGVPFRLPRRTPKPRIYGPQTARVVGPAGAQPESIHTDEHGRCKVKFHWDRSDVTDDKASCWMRVAQQQTSGSLILPRLDWEVVVQFLEGDPDRPVIDNRFYDGTFMPPYALPEGKTRTVLRTMSSPGGGGANEIRIEDKSGAEEIMVQAQKDMTIATANNKTKNVGNCETSVVAANSSLTVGADQTVKVTMGCQSTVSGDQTVSVGANRNVEINAVTGLTVHGSATTSVGANQLEQNGNPLEALLSIAAQAVAQFAAAKAGEAVARIQGHVQGAVDQALGPINQLAGRAQQMQQSMEGLRQGNLSEVGPLMQSAGALPSAGPLAAAMGGRGNGAGGGGGGGPLSGIAAGAIQARAQSAQGLAASAIGGAVGAGHQALASALGLDAQGGGGASMANQGGPEGSVGGQQGTDRAKGPGHAIWKIGGSQTDNVGGLKVVGSLLGMDTNVAGSMTENAGAAHVEVVIGNRAEAVGGAKTETAAGLVVLSKAGESETVAGPKTTMVGGAIIDLIKGSHAVQAGAPATFIGAFHKMEAKGKITFKCGASELVIDGGGVTITSPLVTFTAGKIHLPKKVTEV
jgi:type VI secretion system secreted protein VgrG